MKIGKDALPKLRHSVREDFKRMFWFAFDGASISAKCERAALTTGVSADTFYRICNDDTEKVEFALVLAVAAIYATRPGAAPMRFAGLMIRAQVPA